MKRRIFCFLAVLFTVFMAFGQDQADSTIIKTIELQEVVVRSIPIEKYAVGSSIQKLDKQQLENSTHSTLDDLLSSHSSIYMKEYGNGMASSISVRGTSSSQTAIIWNGVNINSLTLGSLDLSLVPMAAIDRVEIHYGSGSSLYGSDAIGGAIHLMTGHNWSHKGFSGSLRQENGSFGTRFTSGSASFGTNKYYWKTSAYNKFSRNNFPFKYRAVEQRQNHAAYQYTGFVQEAGFRLSDQQTLTIAGWYNANERQIQPNMQANISPPDEELEDKNLRLTINYKLDNRFGFFNFSSGYVSDDQKYATGNNLSRIATNRLVNLVQFEKDISTSFTVRAGGEWTHIRSNVDSYEADIVENRNDGFVSLNLFPVGWLKTSFNIRKTMMGNGKTPFTTSFGSQFMILEKDGHLVGFKGLWAHGYRIPTLNDRYWPRSGNPNLLPEKSRSLEFGVFYNQKNAHSKLNMEFTHYFMKVKDMIQWIPAGADLWRPYNIRKVDVVGSEVHMDYQVNLSKQTAFSVFGNYAFTNAVNKADHVDGKTVDKKIPYVPQHSATLYGNLKLANWNFGLNNRFTGKRFEKLENRNSLPMYYLTDLDMTRQFLFYDLTCSIYFRVSNIFNVEYQNYNSKAMPGIGFQGGVNITF